MNRQDALPWFSFKKYSLAALLGLLLAGSAVADEGGYYQNGGQNDGQSSSYQVPQSQQSGFEQVHDGYWRGGDDDDRWRRHEYYRERRDYYQRRDYYERPRYERPHYYYRQDGYRYYAPPPPPPPPGYWIRG